jgi:hypothetical protein
VQFTAALAHDSPTRHLGFAPPGKQVAQNNCYKIIAADLGLDNPWEELGGDETESLVAEARRVIQRAQQSLEAKPRKH